MKKVLYFLLVLSFLFTLACANDKTDGEETGLAVTTEATSAPVSPVDPATTEPAQK
jgi:hypothetical protein